MVQPQPQYAQQSAWVRQPYSYKPQAAGGSKDIPITVVIAVFIVIWVMILGGIISYATVAPCSLLKITTGKDNFLKLQDAQNTEPPCEFAAGAFTCQGACAGRPASRCTVWKFDANEGCRSFLIKATTS